MKKMIYISVFIILAATAILVLFLLSRGSSAEESKADISTESISDKVADSASDKNSQSSSDENDESSSDENGTSSTNQSDDNGSFDPRSYAERYRKTVESQKYIIHALGGMNGTDKYINSIDPLRLIYAEGYRLFEADVSFTSDGKLVLAHSGRDNIWTKSDWEDRLGQDFPFESESGSESESVTAYDKHLCSYDTFMNFKIQKKYKATSFKELVIFMAEHDDMFVMIDGGERSYQDTKTFYSAILEETREALDELYIESTSSEENNMLDDVLGRMVVGGQTIEMLNAVKEVYDFPLINFYYNSNDKREGELCKPIDFIHYCDDNGVSSFSVSKDVYDQITAEELEKSTLMSFVFTVNDPAEEARIKAYGADIIGTDFLWDKQE